MNKYIDAEKLLSELNKRMGEYDVQQITSECPEYEQGAQDALYNLKLQLTSLQQEQPGPNLEKELDQWRHKHFNGKRDGDYYGEYLERESELDMARHFYKLGLNARKEK